MINTQANIAVSSSHIASKYPLQHVQVLGHLKHIKPVTNCSTVLLYTLSKHHLLHIGLKMPIKM